ncbi:MAG: signal recognition particle protein [Desulfobulbaceae bacterium]|jgi:signal recognition particle subunit SRP54|nr:signal recognition particle protein [Desulfobulbaceae bacterium]HKJ15507.1 signal recognition particle protein [Desulfobulbales bacterium]MDH3776907.1 signal recognition particle protein [Desulfobulbaceae bacterium]MDH3781471.1 signal recognition particle protein [Desulfobulbaceae bacterium]MDH3865540.1 signal recognition particle protein [Desulfobulbaceae bacterium]
MFENLTDKLQKVFRDLRGYGRLTPENIDAALRQVRLALLEADVNFKVVKEFIAAISARAVGQDVLESLTPGQQVIKIVHQELVDLLGGQTEILKLDGRQPVVIMLAGLQGSGKTTTAAKLAKSLKSKGRRPYLVPADVYRPAAIDQLMILGESIGVEVHPSESSQNPVAICRNALIAAGEKNLNTVIIDTAGRLHIDQELMEELRQIKVQTEPAEILFVADAMTGQDAVTVAEKFKNDLDLTGVVLTKMEGDARGGAALSIKKVTDRPIKFVGVGEDMDALEVFHPDRLASRILGMGDVLSLIEKAEAVVDKKQAEKLAKKIQKNEFTLEDFRDQIQQIKKMGSIEQIMGMIPGLNKMKQAQNMPKPDERELVRTEAIINSMTRVERRNYQIINASRRQRIAGGSGTSVQDVNRVIKSYSQMLKMMKKMKGFPGGMAGGKKKRKLPKGLRR